MNTIPPEDVSDIVSRLRALLERCGPYLPLRLEQDWTWEINGAEGSIIAKCPYPKSYAADFAALFVETANSLDSLLTELQARRDAQPADREAVIEECGDIVNEVCEQLSDCSPQFVAERIANRFRTLSHSPPGKG